MCVLRFTIFSFGPLQSSVYTVHQNSSQCSLEQGVKIDLKLREQVEYCYKTSLHIKRITTS